MPSTTITAMPARKIIVLRFAYGGSSRVASTDSSIGSIVPASMRRWYSGSSSSSLPTRICTKHATTRPDDARGITTMRMSVIPNPTGSNRPTITAIAALTGLAVMANCDAVAATAIGRSGRTLLK
jgi:hypothetical protein